MNEFNATICDCSLYKIYAGEITCRYDLIQSRVDLYSVFICMTLCQFQYHMFRMWMICVVFAALRSGHFQQLIHIYNYGTFSVCSILFIEPKPLCVVEKGAFQMFWSLLLSCVGRHMYENSSLSFSVQKINMFSCPFQRFLRMHELSFSWLFEFSSICLCLPARCVLCEIRV